ncbi:TrbG/VirB9 family P-type conjugative transfer protein [Undibacterium arcticum]
MTILSYLTCRSKVMLLLASAFLATGASGAQPGAAGYNFSYSTKGDRSVWPTQVFDNGTETYFQFNPDRTIPAIFALTPCGNRVLITPRSQGPYLVVPGLYKKTIRSSSVLVRRPSTMPVRKKSPWKRALRMRQTVPRPRLLPVLRQEHVNMGR